MTSYWKKKMKELEESHTPSYNTTKPSNSSDYWKSKISELDEENRKKQEAVSAKTKEIAPVKEEKERSWFQKGAFEDGYQFGDVFKTLSATGQDLHSNVMSGLLGIVENTIDAGAYVTGAVGGLFSEDFKEGTKEFIAKDIINEKAIAEKIVGAQHLENLLVDTDNDRDSLLGEKTEGVAQSGGQLLGTVALQSVGVPWFVTSGVTSFGGEVENAFAQGADYIEAGISGVVTAGAEMLTEKISGGINFGAGTLDDVLTKKLATEISNKAVRTMAKFGMDILGEGSEEIISQFVSNLGSSLYREENLKDILFSEEAVDEYIESFIGGAMLGGVSSGASTVDSIVHKKDATTGLTANEEKVFKKVYEDRIAEAEEGGKKLTSKEKNQIYDEVMEDLERGGISTEAIEEALGVESYKTYKDTVDSEEALKKELEELRKMKSGDMNDIQTERLAELKGMNLTDTRTRDTLFKQYEEEISGLVKGSKLAESYNERARRGQVFEADLSKYDEKQKAVVQKAIDSGILNNTRRTHEFVDMVAKLSADKGVLFDFTNNENLKNSGFAVDGKFVNGYYDSKNKSIGLNIDSKKALNTVVGHEITHVLEGTELYGELQKAAFEYAKTKKDYDGRRKALESLYDAKDIDSELTADLVGEYLFDDPDFVKSLSVNNRNVFQKIYDEIKYLCKIATAGSKEKRQLETVKRAFEKAYKEGGKTAEKSGDTKYSISDKNIKDVSTGYGYGETYFTMSYEQDGKTVGALEYGEYDGQPNVKMVEVIPEYRRKGIATKLLQELQKKYPDTEIDFGMTTPDGTKLLDSITYDVTDEAVVADRQKLKDLQTELNDLQEKLDVLYDTENLTEAQEAELHTLGDRWTEVYDSIRDLEKELRGKKATKTFVKTDTQYSLTAEQQEYFKDSKIRDKDGNLIKLYHGTMADFTEFDISKSGENYNGWSEYGEGVYLTPDKKMAQYYADNVGLGRDTKLMELYANVSNPFNTMEPVDFDISDLVQKYELTEFDESFIKKAGYRLVDFLKTHKENVRTYLTDKGYDGVWDMGYNGEVDQVVVYDSNQVKNIDNTKPTENPDIRYSLSDSDGKKLTKEQQEYFKDSKVRDENGSLKVMYHGTPNGDFTVFKDGTYFTENKEYADLYQNPGASSISTGKVVTNPKTFEVYLDIKKPFDISDPEARSVYINDYIKGGNAVGINPYLSEAEYNKIDTIDWTEGEDLREFLIDNGYDYDGLVLDEGAVGGYGEDVKYRGKSYVVFSPEQVKNKDNQNPTSNPDIRYSLTEYTAEEKKAHNDAVLKHFGKTYKWAETGYLLLDGTRLDLSGKHDGAPGGYRTVDHRDITEALGYDYGGGDYSGSLIQFMSEGNIRIIPESNGINLSVKPTKAQEQALSDFISRYRGEVMLDIDDSNGYTVVSVEYPYGTYYTRVLNDIREWFDNGKKPEVSGAYPFRSLSAANEQQKRSRNGIYGEDIRFDAPIKATDTTETAPEEVAPVSTPITESEADEIRDESFASLDDTDAPIEREPFMADYERQAVTINNDSLKQITDKVSNILSLDKNDTARLSEAIQKYAENPDMTGVDLVNELRQDFKYTEEIENYDDRLEDAKRHMKGTHIYVPENLKGDFDGKSKDGFNAFRKEHFGHFYLTTNESAKAIGIDQAYQELRELFPEHFPEDIWNPADQLQRMGEVASSTSSTFESMDYDDATLQEVSEIINSGINQYSQDEALRIAEEARNDYFNASDDFAPVKDKAYEAIRPKKETKKSNEPKLIRVKDENARPGEKQRKWVDTSTDSEAVGRKILPEDLNQDTIHYQPISNKKTLGNANAKLNGMGYESSVAYFNSQFANKSVSLDDVALGERLIQEAIKRGDTKTAGELIQNVAILGTELGQKVQALSIIKRLTPEGQLGMLQKTVERGKTKGDKAYEGVEFTQDMIDHILKTYGKDGTYDQKKLNKAVEDVKQKIADQMKVTKTDKVNAWRYLSMLGNPKSHDRNIISNVAMRGTVAAKNVVARSIEGGTNAVANILGFDAPIKNRTKTWKRATDAVKKFAQTTTMEMKDEIMDGGKYSEDASIKAKRAIFKNKILNGIYEFNSDLLAKEDWWFSKSAYSNSLSEYLTANGIRTAEDIQKHPETVEKAKQYAMEQAQIATFRQYSWLANKINEIERKNTATGVAVGAVLPFKKTPINIAKAALNYSPLGFVKTLTYDASQVKKGEMEASKMIDNLAQNLTGSALTLAGYMLAQAGFLNGGGEDDKEGDYDYQLGEQAYSVNIGDATFSLSWLSPIAMPLFVGANAYEQLVEGKEWNGDVVIETLAQTLDPLSEMSFLSSLDDVLSSYDSGVEKFAGIGQSMAQNYITQFAPTLMSQVAQVMDDTKRSTKVAADSEFKFVDETINKLKYKIPFLRETLEPSTDIWGNEVKQTEDIFTRAVETFIAPYAKRDNIATEIDEEIKDLYRQTGDTGLIPSIPYNYINYDGSKYEMSAKDFTDYKKAYGQTAYDLMEKLFDTDTYRNATSEERADMVNKVYDYARDEAKRGYFTKYGVDFTNAEKEGVEYYKENSIKGAIENDMTPDEYEFSTENPEKYDFLNSNGVSYDDYKNGSEEFKDAYTWAFKNPEKFTLSKAVASDVVTYRKYASELYDIKADKDEYGKSISGSRKEKVADYINNLDIDYGEKIILFKNEYNADDTYNREIIDYLNSREDISFEEMRTILIELGFRVDSKGHITWD